MEIEQVILILGVFVSVFAIVFMVLGRQNPSKKAQKSGSDGVSAMYNVYNQQVEDVLKLKDNQIKRLNSKISQLEPEEEGEEEAKIIPLEGLKPLLASKGINPALLDLPFVQKLIKKHTKGMSIEEILALAQQFGLTGSGKSESDFAGNSQKYF